MQNRRSLVSAGPWRRAGIARIANVGFLILFVLFISVVGVRRAEAQFELTLAGCVVACSGAFIGFSSSVVCGGCLVYGGRQLSAFWLGDDAAIMGFSCAKANIDC